MELKKITLIVTFILKTKAKAYRCLVFIAVTDQGRHNFLKLLRVVSASTHVQVFIAVSWASRHASAKNSKSVPKYYEPRPLISSGSFEL